MLLGPRRLNGGFTLIELLIVIGIFAILSTIVVLVLNPTERLREAADLKRISDVKTLFQGIDYISGAAGLGGQIFDPDGPNFANDSCKGGANQKIFISVPSDNGETPPTPPSGWAWQQVIKDNLKKTDGNGWIPIDFKGYTHPGIGSVIETLPVDPINTFESGLYYVYVCGSYEVTALMASQKYRERIASANTKGIPILEMGNDLNLAPERPVVNGASSSAPTVSSINPNSGINNGVLSVSTISGTNFQSGAIVSLVRTGEPSISGTGFSLTNSTLLSNGSFNLLGVATGSWSVVITNPDNQYGSCVGCLTVNSPSITPPIISSITPSSSTKGTNGISIVILGSNFQNGATVSFSGSGITVVSTIFNSSSQLTISVDVASNATTGARNMTVLNPDGGSDIATSIFTINAGNPAPTVSSLSPSGRGQGATSQILTISGSDFQSGAAVSFSGTGITVNSVSFVNSSTLTTNVSISGSATVGSRTVNVTNPDAQIGSCVGCFAVTAKPVASSVSPSSGDQGNTVAVTVNGSNFQNGATVAIGGSGVTASSTSFVNSTQLNLNFIISGGAATTSRDVTVTNPDNGAGTGSALFSVTTPPLPQPTVSSISPIAFGQGVSSQSIAINGSNFVNGAVVSFSGSGITINSTSFVNSNQLNATISVALGAAVGARNVVVTNPDTQAGTCVGCLTINAAPAFSSINPTSTAQNTTLNVTLNGSNFASGATVAVSGTGVTVNSASFVNSTQLSSNITVSPSAATGTRAITITNPDGGSNTSSSIFRITASPASTTKTFTFDSGLESFVATCVTVVCTRDTSDGNPGIGDLQERLTAQNSNQTWQWEISGITWQTLGVPTGATVTGVDGNYRHRVASSTNMSTAGSNTSGVLTVRDSTGTSTLATLENALTYGVAATTTWATRDALGVVAIPSGSQASNTSIRIRLAGGIRTTNFASSDVALRQDQIVLIITYIPQ